jgi:NAD(P)-dependent dehydrogenase (short-subunit alcohol dehydrogenase family)
MQRFDGRRVLLTGAASGIGRATARRLVAEGATVVGVDRDADGLEVTRTEVGSPERFLPRVTDVADEESVIDNVAGAVGDLGGLDVLVNVAGIHVTTPLETLDVSDVRRMLEVNLIGTMLCCREAVPHLPDGSGVIVNTASSSATHGNPYMGGYAASKAGVLAFSLTLAAELSSRRIRVVPVSPGGVSTPLSAGPARDLENLDVRYYARIKPYAGLGKPEDIAGAIAFAASDDGAYLNGAELRIDGGAHT